VIRRVNGIVLRIKSNMGVDNTLMTSLLQKKGWFCKACEIPVIGDLCERCGRPSTSPKIPMKLTPVFKEELQMLADATGEPVDCFESLELWTANRYSISCRVEINSMN